MRRPVLLATALVLALAGCSDDEPLDTGAQPRPSPVPTATASAEVPPTDQEPVPVDTALRTDDPSALVLRFSAAPDCPPVGVRALVEQQATEVRVQLTADPTASDGECDSDALDAYEVELQLDAPISDRAVVVDGQALAVASGTPPGPPATRVPVEQLPA